MKLSPAVCIAMLCSRRLTPSQAFVVPCSWFPRFAQQLTTSTTAAVRVPVVIPPLLGPPRCLKRPRSQRRPAAVALSASAGAAAAGEGEWEGSLLELDVVEYRNEGEDDSSSSMELASYIGDGKLQPLLTREESGPNLFFHDEEAQPVSVSGGSCRIVRVLDEVYFSQRIVEDRVKNPHGEEAEDCFLVEGTLNPATVVRVEHSHD